VKLILKVVQLYARRAIPPHKAVWCWPYL